MELHIFLFAILLGCCFPPASACPDGFLPWHEGNCYSIIARDFWDHSADNCRDMGGELASIHSALENKRIAATLAYIGQTEPVLTGLHCEPSYAAMWIDGTHVNYRNYPLAVCGGHCFGCAFIVDTAGTWTMVDYTKATRPGLCRYLKQSSERCSDYDAVDGSETCVSIRTTTQTWWLAENQCEQEGGHLLSIHDQNVNDYIEKKIRNSEMVGTSGAFLIGLQTQALPKGETLTWADGSDVNYTNFEFGYPADVLGQCGAIQAGISGGKWISTQCDGSNLPYICSRPVNSPVQAAHCPSNPNFKGSATIFSPSYPGSSGPINNCQYYMTVAAGMKVNLIINDLNTNLCCDRLYLYDGLSATTPFATLSGKADQTSYTTPTSNVLKMVYSSTDGTFVRGWKVTFNGV